MMSGRRVALAFAILDDDLEAVRAYFDTDHDEVDPYALAFPQWRRANDSCYLDLAAKHGSAECVRLLLEKKASPHCIDDTGEQPLELALKFDRPVGVVSLLLAATSVDEQNLALRCAYKHIVERTGDASDVLMLLVEASPGRTARWKDLEALRSLVETRLARRRIALVVAELVQEVCPI